MYLGRIARVLPGIRAAFVDIGMKHDAFLHFSDIGETTKQLQDMIGEDDSDVDDDDDDESPQAQKNNSQQNNRNRESNVPHLHKGQDIIVQITKEPVNNKGVRVTSSVSLPGRFCVLLPFDNKIGVSKRISDFKERRRLRHIARSILPRNYGLIIRTVARNQTEESLKEDLSNLLKTWVEIETTVKGTAFSGIPGFEYNLKRNPRLVYAGYFKSIHRFQKIVPPDKGICSACPAVTCRQDRIIQIASTNL